MFLPNGFSGPVPVIVLVPGGGWTSADPAGLVPLAKALVADGAAVVTVTYRTSSQGAYFPVPAEDVACDLSYAVSAVRGAGTTAGQVVLVGHSAGAQLAALVALRPDDLTGDCSYPPVAPDRFVGLAGPYDITALGGVAAPLFGPDRTDSREWAEGNPLEYATLRPELDVLLVHGQDDGLVPLSLSKQFAVALTRGGHTVETVYPKGVDHASVYEAEVAGPIVAEWLGLPSSTG